MNGIVLVNKPKGISSNTVVNIVKRALGAKKCGHLGTLDLEGEGLLPVTVNSATKLFDYFLNKDKTYQTVFKFGLETDTLDASGEVLKTKEVNFTSKDLDSAILSMIGKQQQMPPLYSAKKVNGKVGYKEARKGNTIKLSPKEIEITSFKLLDKLDDVTYKFEISCSSGTYIRSIARDLGEKLGTYGIMQCILRTRCGIFYLKDAYTIDEIKSGKFDILPLDNLFDYEKYNLSEEVYQKLLNGQILPTNLSMGKYRLFFEGSFIGIGNVKDSNLKFDLRLL